MKLFTGLTLYLASWLCLVPVLYGGMFPSEIVRQLVLFVVFGVSGTLLCFRGEIKKWIAENKKTPTGPTR